MSTVDDYTTLTVTAQEDLSELAVGDDRIFEVHEERIFPKDRPISILDSNGTLVALATVFDCLPYVWGTPRKYGTCVRCNITEVYN